MKKIKTILIFFIFFAIISIIFSIYLDKNRDYIIGKVYFVIDEYLYFDKNYKGPKYLVHFTVTDSNCKNLIGYGIKIGTDKEIKEGDIIKLKLKYFPRNWSILESSPAQISGKYYIDIINDD